MPYRCAILVGSDEEAQYKNNSHFRDVSSTIIIKNGENAKDLINKLFSRFVSQRQSKR